jgi:hypothetical protein
MLGASTALRPSAFIDRYCKKTLLGGAVGWSFRQNPSWILSKSPSEWLAAGGSCCLRVLSLL